MDISAAEPENGRRWPKVVIGALLVAAVLAAGAFFFLPSDEEPELGTVDGIVLESFDGEGEVALASLTGRPLVLNWWASWCTFCIEEMPDFQSVYADVSDQVEFLGVNIQDSPDLARRLARATGVRYPLAVDPGGRAFEAVGAVGMPTTLFVDEEGRIRERVTGPLTAEDLRARLDRHFDL